jgi:uncharacterized membrane protein YphA (DoxX/SURF4 family)
MKFSQYAGTAIIPTLSRLVLALAFITVGFNKLTTDAMFSAEQAEALQEVGVTARSTTAAAEGLRHILPARYPQGEETAGTPEQEAPPPAEAQPGQAEEGGGQIVTRLAEGQYSAKKLHTVTLLCQQAGWGKYSPYLAWLAAVTEFGGGILILVGFLSRIWGLGLAITMGTAIYLTTWTSYIDTGPFAVAQGGDGYLLFNHVFTQLGLGLLALGIFLTGPGPLSLDRLVFGKRGGRAGEVVEASPVVSAMMSSGAARTGAPPERKPQPVPEQGGRSSSERPL